MGFEKNAFAELNEMLEDFRNKTLGQREEALDKASDFMLKQFENATPVNTGVTRKSWVNQKKYKGVRYISNTSLNSKNIPIINLLEFGKKGKPFVRKTFENNKTRIEDILEREITKNE